MPRTVAADPVATGLALRGFSGNGLQNGFDKRPGFFAAARHNRRAVARAFFAARHARADKAYAFGGQLVCTAGGIGEIRIAAVDDDVAFFKVWQQLGDKVVHYCSSPNHQHDFPWFFQFFHQIGNAVRTDDIRVFCRAVEKIVHFGNGAVVGHYFEAFVVHVEYQVLSHYGQTNYADVAFHQVSFKIRLENGVTLPDCCCSCYDFWLFALIFILFL